MLSQHVFIYVINRVIRRVILSAISLVGLIAVGFWAIKSL